MTSVLTKRIYDEVSEHDGLRVLVDRLWPRGVSKEAAALDLWSKDVAPTTALREWFGHRPERFAEFRRRYRKELESNPAFTELRSAASHAKTTTLLFGAKDRNLNEAVVLAEVLETGV